MGLSKLLQDLAFIQKLGDNPNADNNLTAAELKAWFDKAPEAIQKYVNETLIPELEQSFLGLKNTDAEMPLLLDGLKKQIQQIQIGSGFLPPPVIGSLEPSAGPVLWFNITQGEEGTAMLSLLEDAAGPVQASVEGRDYGVKNATVGALPTEKTYDFTVL